MTYNFKAIEEKWQTYWKDHKVHYCDVYDFSKPKKYVLDMFPYPSGQGLHVGHPLGYIATDIVARYYRANNFNVLHPMGFDSFGLPAEQYALKTGHHPASFTQKNIDTFKGQLFRLGLSFDWTKEIATSDPSFYKWTQWIFLKLFESDLAYVDEIPVNWCEGLGTVLSNEEVIDGKSEIGGFPVRRIPMRQWVLRITKYAKRLLADLDKVDWPASTVEMQRNWIGESHGAYVDFKIKDHQKTFTVFTTRPDTLFGATYCVLAPEHPFVKEIASESQKPLIEAYLKEVASKSDLERTELNKDKTGLFTGAYAINPVNQKEIPIYIADYVLSTYGTGAIMAVPAHDSRDYDFAKKYDLPIIPVLEGGNLDQAAFEEDGLHINSDFLNGMDKEEAMKTMIQWLEKEGVGKEATTYRLRDWLFSRQRYWGEPIPIVLMDDGSLKTVPYEDLPLMLPEVQDYKPSQMGQSPLANNQEWLNITIDGKHGLRETNTMPQWAGSCWYYLRYLDPHNDKALADPDLIKHWMPVDLYVGGAEHAVLHLLYARFWYKFLYDIGVVFNLEPFGKLVHQGMLLGENHEKMSKSRGNVVNPDDVIDHYGVDSFRIYEMFMGPLQASKPWSDQGLEGAKRWLERVYRFFRQEGRFVDENDGSLDYSYHTMIKKVTEDIESLDFNTAISQMMIFINDCYKTKVLYKPYALGFLQALQPFAPHIAEELAQDFIDQETLTFMPWPSYDESKMVLDEIEVVVQVNGKLRAKFMASSSLDNQALQEKALTQENVQRFLEGQTIKKIIVIKGKLVNIVI